MDYEVGTFVFIYFSVRTEAELHSPKKFWKKAVGTYSTYVSHIYAKPDEPHPTFPPFSMTKRVDDGTTQGGNAHTGNSGNVFGGSVHNTDTTNNQNMPVLMNMNSNNAGRGGKSKAGCAASGKSSTKGIGGNASSGDSGEAYGGDVDGPPSGMVNVNSSEHHYILQWLSISDTSS